jgi:hypothetical protein
METKKTIRDINTSNSGIISDITSEPINTINKTTTIPFYKEHESIQNQDCVKDQNKEEKIIGNNSF